MNRIQMAGTILRQMAEIATLRRALKSAELRATAAEHANRTLRRRLTATDERLTQLTHESAMRDMQPQGRFGIWDSTEGTPV